MPKFMVLVKANEESEAGQLPSTDLIDRMSQYNQRLIDAGVMKAGEGLHPSSKGARVRFEGGKRTVTDGPFAETKELVAGYWIWECGSLAEAIDWLKQAPFDGEGEGEVEIRQVFAPEDFGENLTPELRERGERQDQQMAGRR